MEPFRYFLETVLNIFPALFWIVDPLVAVPIFLSITRQDTVEKRKSMALRASITTWITLSIFALIGPWVLQKWFNISLDIFQIAGGMILLLTGIDMVRAQPSPSRFTKEEQQESSHKEDISIVPLAIPMLAGPGAMSYVALSMNPTGPQASLHIPFPIIYKVAVFFSIFLTSVTCAFILRYASKAENFLSKTSIRVFERVMGLLITAVAFGFMISGLQKIFFPYLPSH